MSRSVLATLDASTIVVSLEMDRDTTLRQATQVAGAVLVSRSGTFDTTTWNTFNTEFDWSFVSLGGDFVDLDQPIRKGEKIFLYNMNFPGASRIHLIFDDTDTTLGGLLTTTQ
jgi:hypothetical protein